MKDELLKKLDRISDLEDRRLLKNILLNVFDDIVDHNMSMYETLERNIYNEIEDTFEKYYVSTTVDSRNNIDPISDFYHPMCKGDLEESIIDLKTVAKNLKEGIKVNVTTLFMEMPLIDLNKLILEKRHFNCNVETEQGTYNCKATLKKSNKYLNQIEHLYRVFQFNEKDWKTVNYGYAHKFVDVFIEEVIDIGEDEEIKAFTIDLEEYQKNKKTNIIMFWNVKEIEIEDKSFPKPLLDSVHYEHNLDINGRDYDCGFLINNNHDYIKYIKQTDHNIIVANNSDNQGTWNVIQIESANRNIRKNNNLYKELNNRRNLGFIGRFANEKALVIRTRGELARLFQSYDLSKELAFYDVSIVEDYKKEIQTVDLNHFLDNNLRNDPKRSFMVLKFRSISNDDFLLGEKLSFFTSIAGLMFPEYKCVGEVM